jgi:predicted RNase H-like HicB family nuclease
MPHVKFLSRAKFLRHRSIAMEIPIIVEPITDNGFRASSGGLWGLETEASTREEAIEKLRQLIDGRLQEGAEVVGLEIRGRPHPLARFAGILKNEPLLELWKDAMAEYRQQAEDR